MGNVQNQQKYKEESVISEHFDINDNMQQIVGVMLPVYLVDDEVCSSDIELTQRSWKMILGISFGFV